MVAKPNWQGLWYKTVAAILALAVAALGGWISKPETVVEKPVEKLVLTDGVEYAPTFGWVRDADAIAANLDPEQTVQFAATPAARAVLGDDDVYLWQAVRKVNNRGPPWYPNVNQLSVGCCVGCGFKHCADIVQATAILAGAQFEWKPVSVEVIYGGSRVEVGGGRISGDGSVGAWAKDYIAAKGGIAPMQRYDSADLTTFSPSRAREFGRRGVPADIEQVAESHPVKGAALVRSAAECKRAILQGYPVAVCSDRGFRMDRDREGFSRPQGTWYHCMAIIGYRGGARPGFFILNSWGDEAHTGPVYPADAPAAGFWADFAVVEGMLRQGDSFALADVRGFPARQVPDDWFIRAQPRRPRDVFAFLSPEWRLCP